MPATLERTVTLDRNLAKRDDRKLRRYGHSFDEAVTAMMNAIVSQRGDPLDAAEREVPGPKLIASFIEAEMMERGLLPMQEFNSTEELIADCLA